MKQSTFAILFVCLGNICRSPTAHAVFRSMLQAENLSHVISVDSTGTGDWHLGCPPDRRTIKQASLRGYDMSDLRARNICLEDFSKFDYILAMDNENLTHLRAMCPHNYHGQLELFLKYSHSADYEIYSEVPDPYYGKRDDFCLVVDLIEDAAAGLLSQIKTRLL